MLGEDIIAKALFTEKNVDLAWNGSLASFTQNVVLVNKNMTNKDSRQTKSFNGTGTLIDVGIPELEGRVVVTCAHVVLPDFEGFKKKNNNIKELFSDINGGTELISIGSQKLRHFRQIKGGFFRKAGRFDFGKKIATFSINAECQRGKFSDEILISDIYFLTGDDKGEEIFDMAVCILGKPVKHGGEIIPGVKLSKLNVFTETERIDATSPFHIHLESTLGHPVVIGYGLTGLRGLGFYRLLSCLSAEQERSIFGSGIKKAMILNGLDLNGQGVLQNMKGCNCAEYSRLWIELSLSNMKEQIDLDLHNQLCETLTKEGTNYSQKAKTALNEGNRSLAMMYSEKAKAYLEEAKKEKDKLQKSITKFTANTKKNLEQFGATKSSYAGPLAENGFSGSLVIRESGDESINAIGIYSGPPFRDKTKRFIENGAQWHYENYLRKNNDQGFFKWTWQWIVTCFSKIRGIF